MCTIDKIFFYIWMLPQNLIGVIMMLILNKRIVSQGSTPNKSFGIFVVRGLPGAVSLGKYIFIGEAHAKDGDFDFIVKHEVGHFGQSILLGPLYLIVIGIPSFLWAVLYYFAKGRLGVDYYSFYTEKLANYLSRFAKIDIKYD